MTDDACRQGAGCLADTRADVAHRARGDASSLQDFESCDSRIVEANASVVEDHERGWMRQCEMRCTSAAVRTGHNDLTAHFLSHGADAVDDKSSHFLCEPNAKPRCSQKSPGKKSARHPTKNQT